MKLCFRYFILIFGVLLLTSSVVESSASTNPEGKLIITGTGSNIGAMQRMGEGFQKKHLNVKDDDPVKSRKYPRIVIPVKTGIQRFRCFTKTLDTGFHRCDDFLRERQT
jgi:hypothetical protein